MNIQDLQDISLGMLVVGLFGIGLFLWWEPFYRMWVLTRQEQRRAKKRLDKSA